MTAAIVLRLSVVLLAVACGVTSSALKNERPARPDDTFAQHIGRVRRFPCSKPQPRAVASIDLMTKTKILTYEQIIPAMTVLHKCDSGSGCCMQGTCMPETELEVTLEFKVIDQMSGTLRQVMVEARNHTLCSCSDWNHLPK